MQKTMVFTMFLGTFKFSSPSDPKLPPTCKLPEPSLVDMKLQLALLILSWAQPGQFKPILKPTWHPSCSLQASKLATRPPNIDFASFLKALCLQKSAKNVDVSYVFPKFFDISAFSHLALQDQAFQTQNLPQDALLDPPRRAKEGPR